MDMRGHCSIDVKKEERVTLTHSGEENMNQRVTGNLNNFKRRLLFVMLFLAAISVLPGSVGGQDLNRKEGNFVIRDFHFQSGEVLPEVRLHYVTLGTPKRDAAGHAINVVLLLHGTGGSSASFLRPAARPIRKACELDSLECPHWAEYRWSWRNRFEPACYLGLSSLSIHNPNDPCISRKNPIVLK